MSIKLTNHFHCKTLQKLTIEALFVWKYTIWQHCYSANGYFPWMRWPGLLKSQFHVSNGRPGNVSREENFLEHCGSPAKAKKAVKK
jgi:hypothetical protein